MNVSTQLASINLNCTKSILSALENKGFKDIDIAKRCGCNPSRIHAWKNGGNAGSDYLQKLRALLNERLPNHRAFVHDVVSKVAIPVDEAFFERFLTSLVSDLEWDEKLTTTLEQRQQLLEAATLEEVNRLLADSFHQKVCKEVDIEVSLDRNRPISVAESPNYVKATKVLSYEYQSKMKRITEALSDEIEEVEHRLQMLEKRKEDDQQRIQGEFNMILQQLHSHQIRFGEEFPSQQLEDKLEWLVDSLQPDRFTCARAYKSMVSYMERMAAFMEDCEFGARHNSLELSDRNAHIPDTISDDEHIFSADDLGFAVDSAKRLMEKFTTFSADQEDKYNQLFHTKASELGIEKRFEIANIFDVSKASAISDGKQIDIEEFQSKSIDSLLEGLLKKEVIHIALFDHKFAINLLEKAKKWYAYLKVTPVRQTVQINGELIYQSNDNAATPTIVYALENNDLVLLRQIEVCEENVIVMKQPLSATELLGLVENDHLVQVREALLTRGYLLNDVLTIA